MATRTKSNYGKSKNDPKRAGASKKAPAVKQRRNSGQFKPGNSHAFKSGQSGNPAGRPKSRTLSEELRARLEEQYPDRPGATYARMVAEKLIDMAIDGGYP